MAMNPNQFIACCSDPAFGVDRDMRVTGWNAAAQDLMGYSELDVQGMRCGHVLRALFPTGEPLCTVLCEGHNCVENSDPWTVQVCHARCKNGDSIPVRISSTVFPEDGRQGDPYTTVAIFFLHALSDSARTKAIISPIRVYAFGRFALATAERGLNVEAWKRKQAALVFKCLVSQLDKPVHREKLIEWVWPEIDSEKGWQRLKVTISALRAELRNSGNVGEIVETVGQSYVIRSSVVWVDFDEFSKQVSAGWDFLKTDQLSEALARFEKAEALYRGELFENEPYADWCIVERERLRELYMELLIGMAKCLTGIGQFAEAVRACQRGLTIDPCRENFVRGLMENLSKLNRPDWARAHFLSWRNTLEREYGLSPTEQTLSVYSRIIDEAVSEAV